MKNRPFLNENDRILIIAFLVFIAIGLLSSFISKGQQIATTDKTHRKVLLYDDNTWKYYETEKRSAEPKEGTLPKRPAYQCTAFTHKGIQCKIHTTDSTHICFIHKKQLK